jgi:hypothetical protein
MEVIELESSSSVLILTQILWYNNFIFSILVLTCIAINGNISVLSVS